VSTPLEKKRGFGSGKAITVPCVFGGKFSIVCQSGDRFDFRLAGAIKSIKLFSKRNQFENI